MWCRAAICQSLQRCTLPHPAQLPLGRIDYALAQHITNLWSKADAPTETVVALDGRGHARSPAAGYDAGVRFRSIKATSYRPRDPGTGGAECVAFLCRGMQRMSEMVIL